MTKVKDIIEKGQPIPDDVIGVLDCDGDDLVLNALGHWHRPNSVDPATCSDFRCGLDPTEYAPLTVTAVREPDPICDAATCEKPGHMHREPLLDVTSRRESGRSTETIRCPECGCTADQGPPCTDEWHSAVEPQRDATHAFEPNPFEAKVCAHGIGAGHYCGQIATAAVHQVSPQQPEPSDCRSCGGPEEWRPLLVGGNLVPEHPAETDVEVERLRRLLDNQASNFLAATNKLIVERDHWKQRFRRQTSAGLDLCGERDEARAEVGRLKVVGEHLNAEAERVTDALVKARAEAERLRSDLTEEIGHREESDEWADRLANAVAAHLGVDIGEHSNANLPWQAALIALAETKPAYPLVLSLPTVPDGAVALLGPIRPDGTRTRFIPHGQSWWRSEADDRTWSLAEMLDTFESVTVEMAPQPEPRIWPKLNDPEGLASILEVKGHGRFVLCIRRELGNTTYVHEGDVDEHGVRRGLAWTLGRLRELGDVTEVFDDEPGGAA